VWRDSDGLADHSRCAQEAGEPLGALNRVALRLVAPALAPPVTLHASRLCASSALLLLPSSCPDHFFN
jgi:hypothetical protein